MENLANFYFEKLETDQNPSKLLTQFLDESIEKSFSQKDVIMIAKLIKMFGKKTVFFAIIDLYGLDNLNKENLFPLLVYFCKKQLGGSEKISENYFDLKRYTPRHNRKLKESNPFEEVNE